MLQKGLQEFVVLLPLMLVFDFDADADADCSTVPAVDFNTICFSARF